ncbi:MAG: hypothetical protein J2P21_10280 [Chloracidobacterium sp.]|nr:hypothetical protein [Chloracidobacterium sp.]
MADGWSSVTTTPWCSTVRLSADETKILFGGHHRDVADFDATDGRELLSIAVASVDFYVTNVWSSGERLIFTTDAGVMPDGRIERNSRRMTVNDSCEAQWKSIPTRHPPPRDSLSAD